MRKVLVVAAREYSAAVRTKSFVIGIVLMPALMSAGFVAQALLKDQVDLRPKHFAVIDRTPGQTFYPVLEAAARLRNDAPTEPGGARAQTPFLLEAAPISPGTDVDELRLALSERVKAGELTGFLEIGPEVLDPPPGAALTLMVRRPRSGREDDDDRPQDVPGLQPHALRYQTNRPSYLDFAQWAEATVSATVLARRAQQKGIAVADLVTVVQPVPLLNKGLTTRDPATGAIREGEDQSPVVAVLLPGGLVVLMFMVVFIGAAPMLQGVIEEKMQRIAEVLLGSVQPFQLMMGKLIGMAGVSLTLAAVYLGGAYWAVHHFGYAEYLSPPIIAWFLVFQVLAVFLFGSIYAAVGAACTDMKEAQAMLTPVTLVTMLPLFVWFNVVKEPTSAFATLASFFPPATPMLMVARQAIPPGIPLWQPLLGVVLVLATTVLAVYAAGRIFRIGILMQGKGARFADLVRWVIRG
jgi:ABC-2 type transport system permease protein